MKRTMLGVKPIGATSSRSHFEGITKRNQKGITLIALIITIIVMLVLVGVTINVALTGGLFEKGEKAAYQTNVATIKEQVSLKIAEELADNNGRTPDKYNIGIGDIGLSQKLVNEFKDKLTISEDGKLYYIDEEVNEKEKTWLQELGIGPGGVDPFIFDTWYVHEDEHFSNDYLKFSKVGDKKIIYTYSGVGENIEEVDVTEYEWNRNDATAFGTYQFPEEFAGVNAKVEYKWIGDTIIMTVKLYSDETGEMVYEQETRYTKTVPEQGEEYPFKFCYHIDSVGGGTANILNWEEFDNDENRYVEVNGTYSFKFELKQGKHMSVNVRMNDNELSENQYSFTNNLLVIPNVTGPVRLTISTY